MASGPKLVLILLLAVQGLLVGVSGQWPGDESQQCDASAQDSSECDSHTLVPPPACICSDVQVQPDAKVPNSPIFTCAQQFNDGNCNQPFMKDSIVGIPEGYCQVTCGFCNCTMTVSQVLHQLQANTFLQAAEMTGIKQQFDSPGFAATVLAPSDTAFAALFNGADLDTLSNSSLLAIMELHILPPVPVLLAPWTTPFFAANPSLPTWLGPNLTATSVSSGGANFSVSTGTGPAASVITADMEASRAYVNLLDRVLTPPANAVPVIVPASGSGPNGTGTAIETFRATAAFSLIPGPSAAIQTAG